MQTSRLATRLRALSGRTWVPRSLSGRALQARGGRAAPARASLVGIDLGTTNSVVAAVPAGTQQAVVLGQLPSLLRTSAEAGPLVVAGHFEGDVVGAGTWFSSVKRLMGRTYAELGPAQAGSLPYQVAEAADGAVELYCPVRQEGYSPVDLSAVLLRRLVALAEESLQERVQGAIITVPAHFGERQREATQQAGLLAGLQRVELLQEPVAAAMAHGLGLNGQEGTFLVFDLGGGTFDCSIVEAYEGCLEVVATGGDSRLGGDDWDRCLLHCALRAHPQHAQRLREDAALRPAWQRAAEAAKLRLSTAPSTVLELPASAAAGASEAPEAPQTPAGAAAAAAAGTTEASKAASEASKASQAPAAAAAAPAAALELELSREEFEAATLPLRQRLWQALDALGRRADVEWAGRPPEALPDPQGPQTPPRGKFAARPRRIEEVVLVGAATRTPSVRALVGAMTGLPVQAVQEDQVDPETCVAVGAALQVGVLEGRVGGLELADGSYSAALHGRASGF